MVQTIVQQLASFMKDLTSFVPPGLFPTFATAFIEGGKYFSDFRHEFVGSMLMIAFTFQAGKWIGKESIRMAWTSHACGVIAADYIGGGPHVNPAVTVSMWTLGKCSYTQAYVRIAGQLAGGLVSFPLYHAISNAMEWTPFGGPEYNQDLHDHATAEAFLSEFSATFCLMFAIYALNWEINFGTYHYIIKQTLTAVAIRALIEIFPTAGPAMNPMLATTWHVFGVGTQYEYPADFEHYFVYWIAPFAAAILASITYVIFVGGTVYGKSLPIGPLKKSTKPTSTTGTASKKKKKN